MKIFFWQGGLHLDPETDRDRTVLSCIRDLVIAADPEAAHKWPTSQTRSESGFAATCATITGPASESA